MTHEACREAWAAASAALADTVHGEARTALEAAARHARYPTRRLVPLLPDAEQRDILYQQLLAAAIPLERLAGAASGDVTTRARGAALEAAWDEATGIVRAEASRWRGTAARLMAWRRPWRPVVVAGTVALLVTLLVAGWLGGQVTAPEWFAPIASWFWGLPWR